MKIVIFGPQGSGKGTQAELLKTKLNLPHIATGELLRTEIAACSSSSEELKKRLDLGELAEDEMINQLLVQRLTLPDAKNGYILDGYPRNKMQIDFLEKLSPPDAVLEIRLSDDEVLSRLSGRRTCVSCGAIFHIITNPPEVAGRCNNCGDSLIVRSDDQLIAIGRRLNIYHQATEPAIEYYKGVNKLFVIDGRPSIVDVATEIWSVLEANFDLKK